MKYRLRPAVETEIEAERFNGSLRAVEELAQWSDGRVYSRDGYVFVMTRNGAQRVYAGDYVVRDAKGNYGVMTAARLNEKFEVHYGEAAAVQSVAPPRKNGRPAGSNVGVEYHEPRDEPAEMPSGSISREWVRPHRHLND
jgi:hypothetical protein